MMSRFYVIIACFAFLFSCTEAEEKMYDGPDAIYFKSLNAITDTTLSVRDDTVYYTFAFYQGQSDRTIFLPVEILGFASNNDRHYKIQVTEYNDTRAGVHYDALDEVQLFHKGKTVDSLKVVFHNVDMDTIACKIGITIHTGGDFVEGTQDSLFVAVQVSNILEEPVWWEHWESCFGPYHRIKYEEWIKIWGTQDLDTSFAIQWYFYPKELTVLKELKRLFEEKEFYDEKGNRLTIPMPY